MIVGIILIEGGLLDSYTRNGPTVIETRSIINEFERKEDSQGRQCQCTFLLFKKALTIMAHLFIHFVPN